MLTSTNGAGVTLTYAYNVVPALTTLTSSLSDSNHPGTLLSSAHYNSAGSLLSATLGGSVSETRTYDARLRLASIADGSNYSLTIPSSGGYAPNSDILTANDSVNSNWVFAYDDFNRLICSNLATNGTCASPTSGTATYTYDYDRYGNRWHQNGPWSMQLSFSGNNNRMDSHSYDSAGNLLNDGSHSYFYDAENRLIQVDGTLGTCSSATACYVYNAAGRRVRKTTGSTSVDYLYDLAGQEITELTSAGAWNRGEVYAGGRHLATYNGGTTNLIHADWLGTERVRTTAAGASCENITSLPFGDALSTSGSCGDASPMHFTGKERDSESGLDNFGLRYDSSSLGRFMSSDPGNAGAVNADPQSWNAYAYVRNNPVNLTDPTGAVFCRAANDAEKGQGVSQVCDVTDAQYVNSSKADQAAYDKAGYTHYDCSCDTNADKAAWAERKGNVSNDYIGDALVFLGALAIVRGLDPGAAPPDPRLPQDRKRQDDYPEPPDANNGNSNIGTNPNQDAALRRDIQQAQQEGATDIRVNQEQTNAQGVRVGQNRPDLQYTDRNGIRHYIEYDQDPVNGAAHAQRIRANDPGGVVTPKTVK